MSEPYDTWISEGQYARAIAALEDIPDEERSFNQTMNMAEAHARRAVCGENSTELQEVIDEDGLAQALDVLMTVSEHGADNMDWNLAVTNVLFMMEGREEEALAWAKRAHELDPNDEDAQSAVSEIEAYILTSFSIEGETEGDDDSDGDEDDPFPQLFVLEVNARLQPMHRHHFEDALEEALSKEELGEWSGGGTLMAPGGGVASCEIEFSTADASEETVERVLSIIKGMKWLPRGSQLTWWTGEDERHAISVGHAEGMGIFLNGTDLPDEVYETCDVNHVVGQMEELLQGSGSMLSYWDGPTETALYFYGESFESMRSAVADFMADYPLCEKARVEQIA